MKAAIRNTYGPPSVLKYQETQTPVQSENELLIKVYNSTVNRTDCAILTGTPLIMRLVCGLFRPKNLILGTDFSGTVEKVGSSVSSFQIGDRVLGFHDMGSRSQAEYLVIKEKGNLVKIPQSIPLKDASAAIEGAHYAINILNKISLKKGQNVLLIGATGAIGSALLQFVVSIGASVSAVCRGEHTALVESMGATKVIDYTRENFLETQEKYDFVFDAVGKSTFGKCKPLLKEKGIYISTELGPWSQNLFFAISTPLLEGKKVKFPFPSNIKASLAFVVNQIELGEFKPLIDKKYSPEKISQAYEYVMSGKKVGNVLVEFHSESEG